MLAHAQDHAGRKTEFDNMLTILGLDNTIEYILRIIASHLESLTGENFELDALPKLASSINKTLKENADLKLPYLGDIKLLRKVRNLVQHGVISPSADLEHFLNITQKFFGIVLKDIFGISFEELKISVLIKDERVKEFIKVSENKIDSEDWLESIVASRNAFENEYFERIKHSDISIALYPSQVLEMETQEIAHFGFETIIQELELANLGINNPEFRRFKEYVHHIPLEYCAVGTPGCSVMQRHWLKEDAIYCYNFVANTILRWQAWDKEKLYPLKPFENYKFNETIAGINISKELEGGCLYAYPNEQYLHLFYTTENIKSRFEKLKKEKYYKHRTTTYLNNKKTLTQETSISFLGKHISLITNEPARWGIIIWYKVVDAKLKKEAKN